MRGPPFHRDPAQLLSGLLHDDPSVRLSMGLGVSLGLCSSRTLLLFIFTDAKA